MLKLPAVVFLLACVAVSALAQQPTVLRIDPPSWFAALPSPMLLVEGTNLTGATATISGSRAKVSRLQTSANGHWAMIWLDTQAASAGKLQLTIRTPAGATSVSYSLEPHGANPSGFSSRDVLYLIMPDRFADGDTTNNQPSFNRNNPHAYHGGDLQGIIDHLDYLQQLGVTALWLTPILQNDPHTSDYHGYGATDMYAVDSRLGTLATYRRLADELHHRNMKLVFDDVPNHVGQGHIWATDPPAPDWFHGTPAQHSDNQYVFPPETDPHAAPNASLDALDGWFVNILPDMNQQNPAVAKYLTDNMIWWIEKAGIDGLRIDTFPYVQRDFWQQYLSTLSKLYPRLTAVGEVSVGDPTVNAFFAGGRTLNGIDTHLTTPFDYPLYYSLLDVLLNGKPMSKLEDMLRQDWLYPHPEALVPFIGNHDQVRFLSQPNASPKLLRLGYGLLLTLRGMPELYAGDEIGMLGGADPDNRRDFPGGFPGDPADAFTASGRSPAQAAMHDWVSALGKFRAQFPALQDGRQQTVLASDSTFAYVRTTAKGGSGACAATGSLLIAINRSSGAGSVNIPVVGSDLEGCTSATPAFGDAASPSAVPISGGQLSLPLPPFAFAIYALR